MIDLNEKVALVTGSSRGIGRSVAITLAEAGCDVIVNYVTSQNEALATAKEIQSLGRRCWIVRADVSEEDDVQSMFEFIEQEIGQLDILVSNAATGGFRPLLDSNPKHFAAAMNTNVLALIHLAKAAVPLLEKAQDRGKVIAISSHGSHMALPMYGLIGGSKAALESITRHLALELGDRRINVNVVKSGLVETDSTRRIPGAEKMFAARTAKTMMGKRQLEPSDVANAVAFLASPISDLIQATTITVDGGAAAHV
ncbi:1-cyclohexenylcarbonyl CoA reductase [Rhodopirellula sp. SM50]|nr:SDR family oxidoreductase [Rhodopirellula sp. SM50]PAY17922.1 1-cyclohexenylcarbonyl CoA reductase [Rhodopirellula sp. SM50]